MAVPEPDEFEDGDLAATELNEKVAQPLIFQFNRPFVIARIVTPVALTAPGFTTLVFDSIIAGDGDLLTGVKEPGVYAGYTFARSTAMYGNKNIRAQKNGGITDTDTDDFAGDDNNTGSQTEAKGARSTPFAEPMDVDDFIEVGFFIDDVDTPGPQVVNGRFYMAWQHNA